MNSLLLLDQHRRLHRYYYYGMKVDNKASYEVILKWLEVGEEKSMRVEANGIQDFHCKVRSRRRPKDIAVQAFMVRSGERVMVNDRSQVFIRPTRWSTNRVYIFIEGKGEILLVYENFFPLYFWDPFISVPPNIPRPLKY